MGKHTIIVIKNEKDEYLQYFDERWNSYLFMNCKMENKDDIYSIKEELNKELGLSRSNIECYFVGEKDHTKYSESTKVEKKYIHYFYKIKLLSEPDVFKNKEFKFKMKKYKWFSFDELENDDRIRKVNNDIVGYVKSFNI